MQSQFERVADCLPEVVLEMVEPVRFNDVEKIVHLFGRVNFLFSDGKVYFPKLKALIELESVGKLCRYFSGSIFPVVKWHCVYCAMGGYPPV